MGMHLRTKSRRQIVVERAATNKRFNITSGKIADGAITFFCMRCAKYQEECQCSHLPIFELARMNKPQRIRPSKLSLIHI